MKKISIVSLASFIFLLLCSGIAVILDGLLENQVAALIIGCAILIVSALLAFILKESNLMNIICFLLSSVSMGFLLRAWYINRGFDNSFGLMAFISFGAVLYLWIFFALSKIPFVHRSKKTYIALCVFYAALSIGLYIAAVIFTKTTYVSTFGFYMIIEFAFIFAMSLEVNEPNELIRNLTLSTYSVFGVALIVAVFVILAALGGDADCDCDCLADGCCDCDLRDETKSAKKNKKKGK